MSFFDLISSAKQKAKSASGGAPRYFEGDLCVYPTDREYSNMRSDMRRGEFYAMKLARLWRASCFVVSSSCVILACGWIQQAQKQTIERVFVLVDKKTGDADEVAANGT